MKRPTARRAAACLALLAATGGWAAPACSIATQGLDLSFGVYDPFAAAPLDAAGTMSIDCTAPADYEIALGRGRGSYAARTMTNGPRSLVYNLYTDAVRVTVWGDGTSGTSVVSGTVSVPGAPGVHALYGRIPPGQIVESGSYRDRVRIDVSF